MVKRLSLAEPTATSRSGGSPAALTPGATPFACFQVKPSKGAAKIKAMLGVSVQDEFGRPTVTVKKPTWLCMPADDGMAPGADTTSVELLCYQVQPAKGTPKFQRVGPVLSTDRFGSLTLDAVKPQELCVPTLRNP